MRYCEDCFEIQETNPTGVCELCRDAKEHIED